MMIQAFQAWYGRERPPSDHGPKIVVSYSGNHSSSKFYCTIRVKTHGH